MNEMTKLPIQITAVKCNGKLLRNAISLKIEAKATAKAIAIKKIPNN